MKERISTIPGAGDQGASVELSASELAKLEGYSREELISLIKRSWPPKVVLTISKIKEIKSAILSGNDIENSILM